jgi:hypothetical protein
MNNFTKRILVGGTLGAVMGVVGAYVAAMHGVVGAFDFYSPVFWAVVFNRFSIGILVGIMGFMTVHPFIKGLKVGPIFRGIDVGTWISFFMGLQILASGAVDKWYQFTLAMISGILLGIVIDFIITKRYGQGKQLLDYAA